MKQRFDGPRSRAAAHVSIFVGLSFALLVLGCETRTQPPVGSQAEAGGKRNADISAEHGGAVQPRKRVSRRGRAETHTAPGDFDFYLLNLSWSPEFCATHANSPECGRKLGFVVHGLWPQNVRGDYPEHCSSAPGPANPQSYTDIIPTASLVEHEWQTHGTCSGLTADAYFAAIRKAFARLKIPADLGTGTHADGIIPAQLLTGFARANPGFPEGSFALSCGNNRLTAIEVCLTRDLQPESCMGVRSCRANVIKVAPR